MTSNVFNSFYYLHLFSIIITILNSIVNTRTIRKSRKENAFIDVTVIFSFEIVFSNIQLNLKSKNFEEFNFFFEEEPYVLDYFI
jgi:hypothetical protein